MERAYPRLAALRSGSTSCRRNRRSCARTTTGRGACDFLLGQLLDYFDKHDLWKDTALILSTDHGFLLGEHDFWAKNRMNMYEEIVHIPLFFYHPDHAAKRWREAHCAHPDDRPRADLTWTSAAHQSRRRLKDIPLLPVLAKDRTLRDGAIFGYFGGAVNVTDGRYTYHRYPADLATQEIYQYTLMPTHLWERFSTEELKDATLAPPQPFTKGVPTLKVPVVSTSPMLQQLRSRRIARTGNPALRSRQRPRPGDASRQCARKSSG